MPADLWPAIRETVRKTCERSRWTVRRVLLALGISRSTYHAAIGRPQVKAVEKVNEVHAVLPEEREKVVAYALGHVDLRHRELAWRMVDEDVAFLSASSVYRILLEKDLVCRWERPEAREKRQREKPGKPDERWQSDLRYVKIGNRWYFLITFADEYSRYIVHHELLRSMDADSVSLAAQAAIEKLPAGVSVIIQTDHGSGYVSYEFKLVLSERGIGHHLIRPHCPEENGLIERIQRTLGEKLDEHELEDLEQANRVVAEIIRWYNEERLHSAIGFLRPIDAYRGEPEKIYEARRVKLAAARLRRKEENLRLRQASLLLEDFVPVGVAQ